MYFALSLSLFDSVFDNGTISLYTTFPYVYVLVYPIYLYVYSISPSISVSSSLSSVTPHCVFHMLPRESAGYTNACSSSNRHHPFVETNPQRDPPPTSFPLYPTTSESSELSISTRSGAVTQSARTTRNAGAV